MLRPFQIASEQEGDQSQTGMVGEVTGARNSWLKRRGGAVFGLGNGELGRVAPRGARTGLGPCGSGKGGERGQGA